MSVSFPESFERLRQYCEQEGFKGWDPYDGLTSKLFRGLPFISSNRFFRLAWIQFFKKSPVNLRRLALVPKEYNAKGLALFLTGYCNLYKLNPSEDLTNRIDFLAKKIIELQSPGYSGSCWGYYFDWQARAFFQPGYTPTVVATSFVVNALLDAYNITGNEQYKTVAVSGANFVLHDLNRTYDATGHFAFSYSPIDKTQVFNATLLGARLLSRVYSYTGEARLKDEAANTVQYVCERQQENGAWAYGTLPYHAWIDSFHTGFNLECLYEYQQYTGDTRFSNHIEKGLKYYINSFFTSEGASKYYHNRLYPVDIHAPAQLVITLVKLGRFDENRELVDRVLNWTIREMQDRKGYFYYQRKKSFSSKISYMRWAQAWMFSAMTHYLIATK